MIGALNRPVGRREVMLAAAIGAALVALAVGLLRGGSLGGEDPAGPPAGAIPASAPATGADNSTAAPAPSAPIMPAPPAPAPAPATPPPGPGVSANPAALEGLRLRGILGNAAIIEVPGGRQLLVRPGRAAIPGVVLQAVGRDHALLEAQGQRLRLEFGDRGAAAIAAAPAAGAATRAPAAPGRVIAGLADAAREAGRAYVLGLRPVEENGRTTGFRVVPGARMPGLEEAGLQPGDIIIMVNGMDFTDEERVGELGDEIAGSYETEFEFIRNGQRMKRTVAVNPRTAAAAR